MILPIVEALGCSRAGCSCQRRFGSNLLTHCPAHDDHTPSLSLTEKDGKLLLNCKGGCTQIAVIDALKARDLWPSEKPQDAAPKTKPATKPRSVTEAIYDYTDEGDTLLFQCLRKNPKGFSQRRPAGNGSFVYSLEGVRRVPYHLPEVIAAVSAGKTIYICEGEKDVDRLRSFGLVATCNPMGAGKWLPEFNPFFKDANVVILPDNDPVGAAHGLEIASSLHGTACRVKIVPIPDLPAKDVSDWLDAGGTVGALIQLAKDTPDWTPETENDDLPIVETNARHLRDESADALAALIKGNAPPAIFVRGGQLARVQVNEKNRAVITGLMTPMLRGHLARCANFVSTSGKRGVVPVAPPKDIVEDVLALPQWPGVPALTGIVTAPVFAHDGRMETQAGYHAGARLFYHETCPVPIPDTTPTPENIASARSLIIGELLADFPFADQASRAHAVALLLLPFVRPMIDGPTPLHLIDAPTAGTGKTLLTRVCTLPFTAEGTAAKSPPTEEAEWSKTLTSVFSDGDSHLLLDNVRLLNSPSFFAAITSTLYKDRLLGTNRTGEFENRLVWLATCNNIQGNDELNRRSIWIRLDAGVEQPEDRDGFQHPDLAAWASAHRGELIGAALTIGRAWVEAGKPAYAGTEKPLGSFEAWTRVMGGILQNAGISGFLENRQEQRSRVDTETSSWHGFVESWLDRFGRMPVTTGDLFPLALEWMPERMGDPGKDESNRSQKTKFAKLLTRHVDKVFAGCKITQAGKATSGVSKNLKQYQLETAQGPKTGSHGSHGSHVSLPRVVVSEKDNIHKGNIQVGLSEDDDSHDSHDSRFEDEDPEDELLI